MVRARQLGRVVDEELPLLVVEHHLVLAGGGRGDQLQVELALEALLHDLHVQQAEEAAAEAEAEGGRRLRLKGEAGVVEVQLLERLAQRWVVLSAEWVEAGEDEWQRDLVARKRLGSGARLRGDRVANARVAHALQTGRDVADLARDQLLHRHVLWPEVAELNWNTRHARAHHQNRIARLESPLLHADVVHHAFVRVVVRIKNKCAQWRIEWAARRGNTRDQGFKNLRDADARLRRGEDHLFSRDGE